MASKNNGKKSLERGLGSKYLKKCDRTHSPTAKAEFEQTDTLAQYGWQMKVSQLTQQPGEERKLGIGSPNLT